MPDRHLALLGWLVAMGVAGCSADSGGSPPLAEVTGGGGGSGGGATGAAAGTTSGGSATGGGAGTGGGVEGGSGGTTGGSSGGGTGGVGGSIAGGSGGGAGEPAAVGGSSPTGGSGGSGGVTPTGGVGGTFTPAAAMPPSVNPPGGIDASQAPMFVMFGFDDNAYADGVNWFADLVRDRTNPDGSPVRATFFITAGYAEDKLVTEGGQTRQDIIDAWAALAADGHEIANHTQNHDHGTAGDLAFWQSEITQANSFFTDTLGVAASDLHGFRTPFLEYGSPTFDALDSAGLLYDCSIEFGYDWWQHDPADWTTGHSPGEAETGKWYPWPYTLDEGSPPGSSDRGAGVHPGLWEIPVYTYNRPNGTAVSTVTGFDFNLWKVAPTATDFLDTLKFSFDQRYTGNRSPFSVNAHTDYYSQYNPYDDPEFMVQDYLQRRQAIADFLDYVLSFPEVRVVPFVRVIAWMSAPAAVN